MCRLNNKPPIPREEIEYLMSIQQDKAVETEYKDLFNDKYRGMTLKMMVAWFSACFIYYGIFMLLPSILARNNATSYDMKYLALIIINCFEILCFFIVIPLIESPLFGRKKTMWLTFLGVVALSMLLILAGESNTFVLLLSFLLMRMAIGINAVVNFCFIKDHHSVHNLNLFHFNKKQGNGGLRSCRQNRISLHWVCGP